MRRNPMVVLQEAVILLRKARRAAVAGEQGSFSFDEPAAAKPEPARAEKEPRSATTPGEGLGWWKAAGGGYTSHAQHGSYGVGQKQSGGWAAKYTLRSGDSVFVGNFSHPTAKAAMAAAREHDVAMTGKEWRRSLAASTGPEPAGRAQSKPAARLNWGQSAAGAHVANATHGNYRITKQSGGTHRLVFHPADGGGLQDLGDKHSSPEVAQRAAEIHHAGLHHRKAAELDRAIFSS